jgi:predicted nucleic acid-binding protein
MADCLVDSNVLLDLISENEEWLDWSQAMLADAARDGRLLLNPIVYAEVSVGYVRMEEFEEALPPTFIERRPLPSEAAFLAGKCFEHYRRAGGTRTAPLPDFFIGAHAAVEDLTLLTRGPRRFRAYFPKLRIISP